MFLLSLFLIGKIIAFANSQDDFCYTPSLSIGRCVLPKDCGYVTQQYSRFQGKLPKATINYIRRSRCRGRDNSLIFICCDSSFVEIAPITTTSVPVKIISNNEEYVNRLSPKGLELLNKENCGVESHFRISNGNKTELAEFPWMALLIYNNSKQPFQCSGTLISNRYVLTAAHCIVGLLDKLKAVRLGEYDTTTNIDCGFRGPKYNCLSTYEDYNIEKQIPHPHYSRPTITNDIGLLRLDRIVNYKMNIKPICLPTSLISSKRKENFYITGWGTTEQSHTSNVLLMAELEERPRDVCYKMFKTVRVTENHICAGGVGKSDSCYGDSGGPLFSLADYKGVPRYVQFGVVSFGARVCSSEVAYPGIYANIIDVLPWITQNID